MLRGVRFAACALLLPPLFLPLRIPRLPLLRRRKQRPLEPQLLQKVLSLLQRLPLLHRGWATVREGLGNRFDTHMGGWRHSWPWVRSHAVKVVRKGEEGR